MVSQSKQLTKSIFSVANLAKVVAGFILLVVASKLSIQIGPVPLTMQTCANGLLGA